MAFGKRYTGTFYNVANKAIRVDIMEDGYTGDSGELDFIGEEPLVIEWDETAKEDVICGATATLGIISPGDRTYADLYTIEAGKIRMDVYVDGTLYWSGCLDPEFYEEPYAYTKDYEISLTFSDFGILDRKKWNKTGLLTIEAIIDDALAQSMINYTDMNQDYISTQIDTNSGKMKLADICLRADNFYDEDGEASTLKEVIEGALQPFGMRMVQKGGTVWIYDLNGLYTAGPSKDIRWMDEGQMMGVDKVANDIKITFSPYSKSDQSTKLVYKGESGVSLVNVDKNYDEPGYDTYFNNYQDSKGKRLDGAFGTDWADKITTIDAMNLSFTIFTSKKGSGMAEIGDDFRYFKIQPILGSEETEGVAWGYYTGGNAISIGDDLRSGKPHIRLMAPYKGLMENDIIPTDSQGLPITVMKLHPIYLPTLSAAERKNYYIRIKMEMLMDPRYNPFEESGDYNESGNYKRIKNTFNQVGVAASVYMEHDDGTYTGFNNKEGLKSTQTLYDMNIGEWKAGQQLYSCFLMYYDPKDLVKGCGVLGWKTNRQNLGIRVTLPQSLQELPEGQYIPYPEEGGYLHISIHGFYSAAYMMLLGLTDVLASNAKRLRWLLFKAPTVEIIKNDPSKSAAECDDIEYKGTINDNAKDDIELDTVCGTMKKTMPTAKGCYYKTSDHLQLSTLYRAGRTNQAERLLIGTMCSQYGQRHTKLSGITTAMTDPLTLYTEAMQDGKKFICLADSQDLQANESDMSIVELSADNYDPKDETEE